MRALFLVGSSRGAGKAALLARTRLLWFIAFSHPSLEMTNGETMAQLMDALPSLR